MCLRLRAGLEAIYMYMMEYVDYPCMRLGDYSMACFGGTTFGNDLGLLMALFWMDLVILE